jgi:hypothetical protein
MKYRKGYKYQLAQDEVFKTRIFPTKEIKTEFLSFNPDGTLIVKSGYAWDGPSGPTVDRKENMTASLGHDALYQLIRQKLLDSSCRKIADDHMAEWCIQAGMVKFWANLYRRELSKFARFAANPKNIKQIYEVP